VVFGALDYSMRIWFQTDRLISLGLSPSDIISAIQTQNVQAPVGRIGARLKRPAQARLVGDVIRAATLDRKQTGGRVGLAEVLGENPACTASNLVFRRAVLDALGKVSAGEQAALQRVMRLQQEEMLKDALALPLGAEPRQSRKDIAAAEQEQHKSARGWFGAIMRALGMGDK
jgi:multidrug efflux pump subunit AcrB